MVFDFSVLNWVYNFVLVCRKQGMLFHVSLCRADFESRSCTDRIGFFAILRRSVNSLGRGEGATPLYGLYVDVPMDRVWFLTSLSSTGYIISC